MAQAKTSYEVAEIKDAIDVLSSLYESKGIAPPSFNEDVIKAGMKCLSGFGAKRAFDVLLKSKCVASSLAVLLYLIRSGPRWSSMWRILVGSPRRRRQISAIFEKAASALETVDAAFGKAMAGENERGPISKNPGVEMNREKAVLSPARCAHSLRTYIRVLNVVGSASSQAKIDSPEAFGKYLLSGYVKFTTGDYHDAEVSALISGALREVYSEDAHRMWRRRNCKNLDRISFPLELQLSLGLLLAIQT